jgi:hypothetical protein
MAVSKMSSIRGPPLHRWSPERPPRSPVVGARWSGVVLAEASWSRLTFSNAAKSSRASLISPSSIPSPTYYKGKQNCMSLSSLLSFEPKVSTYPMNESTLRVEQVEFVVQSRPSGSDRSSVGQHAQRSGDLGEITTGDERRRLVADTELETGRTPVDELNRSLGLDLGNGRVDILGHNVTSVQQTTSHVLSLSRVTLDHLVVGFET